MLGIGWLVIKDDSLQAAYIGLARATWIAVWLHRVTVFWWYTESFYFNHNDCGAGVCHLLSSSLAVDPNKHNWLLGPFHLCWQCSFSFLVLIWKKWSNVVMGSLISSISSELTSICDGAALLNPLARRGQWARPRFIISVEIVLVILPNPATVLAQENWFCNFVHDNISRHLWSRNKGEACTWIMK